MPKTRRLQLLLDEERYEQLAAAASAQGVSVATVVREAIDASLRSSSERRAAAGAVILGAEPMEVPEPDELKREVDDLRTRRAGVVPVVTRQ